MVKIILIILIISGCSTTMEILPGLCYDDETTHLCEDPCSDYICRIDEAVQECIDEGECRYV